MGSSQCFRHHLGDTFAAYGLPKDLVHSFAINDFFGSIFGFKRVFCNSIQIFMEHSRECEDHAWVIRM